MTTPQVYKNAAVNLESLQHGELSLNSFHVSTLVRLNQVLRLDNLHGVSIRTSLKFPD